VEIRPAGLGPPRPHASVLALLHGCPAKVALVLRPCRPGDPWSCDPALPGGRIRGGESPVEAALREAWEEAWVPPGMVEAYGVVFHEATLAGRVRVAVVLAVPRGPVELRPGDEVEAAFWAPLWLAGAERRRLRHPVRGWVYGVELRGVRRPLWGFTLRVLTRLYRMALDGALPPQAIDALCPHIASQPHG